VDDAAARLRELRHEKWEDLGLAVVALGLAIGATQVLPSLALPLLFGAVAVGLVGVRAGGRRLDLVERLLGERDAYVLPEILEQARREATIERRRIYATSIRSWLRHPWPVLAPRINAAAEELEALASELDDDELELDPACAVACARLVSDVPGSPLLSLRAPDDLRSRVWQIRSGFSSRATPVNPARRRTDLPLC